MSQRVPDRTESVFTYSSPQLKFGAGASAEVGHDLRGLGATRVLLVTDAGVAAAGAPARIAEQIRACGIATVVFEGSRVEPTDESVAVAVAFGRDNGPFDAVVAVGGGSSIDTAKAVNLLTTNPGDLMEYVNLPVGGGRAPVTALAPMIAIPTTAGTGSESTTVCVLDVLSQKVKTGISHSRLRPTMAVVDPDLTFSQPAGVTAASGMDIVCHALESYTARPYTAYDRKQPGKRVPYCGSNPIADMWSEQALALVATSFRAAVRDGADAEARRQMALAATFAGLGFGNAGVHVPHANAYPIAGQVRQFRAPDYPQAEAMVPHGMAVSLTAPAAFGFTFDACPQRHIRAAELLDPGAERPGDASTYLPQVLLALMRDVGIPAGIGAVGYTTGDAHALAAGTMQQERLLAMSPRELHEEAAVAIFEASVELW